MAMIPPVPTALRSRSVFGLPTASGIRAPGKSTELRSGSTGRTCADGPIEVESDSISAASSIGRSASGPSASSELLLIFPATRFSSSAVSVFFDLSFCRSWSALTLVGHIATQISSYTMKIGVRRWSNQVYQQKSSRDFLSRLLKPSRNQ